MTVDFLADVLFITNMNMGGGDRRPLAGGRIVLLLKDEMDCTKRSDGTLAVFILWFYP